MTWEGLTPPYSTIVVDPPWEYAEGFPTQSRTPGKWAGAVKTKPLPYSSMGLDAIEALPVAALAGPDARLFLWATSRYLGAAFDVMEAWRCRYKQALRRIRVRLGVAAGGTAGGTCRTGVR